MRAELLEIIGKMINLSQKYINWNFIPDVHTGFTLEKIVKIKVGIYFLETIF